MESNIDELIGQYTEEMQRRYEEAVGYGQAEYLDSIRTMDAETFRTAYSDEDVQTIASKKDKNDEDFAVLERYEEIREEEAREQVEEEVMNEVWEEAKKDWEKYDKYNPV